MGTQWWCIVGFCSVITSKYQQLMTRKILSFSLMGLWITWNKCISGLPLGSLSRTGNLQSTHFLGRFWKKWKKSSQITQTHTCSHCIHGPTQVSRTIQHQWSGEINSTSCRLKGMNKQLGIQPTPGSLHKDVWKTSSYLLTFKNWWVFKISYWYIYMESRKMVLMNPLAGQLWRHRRGGHTYGYEGWIGRRGWANGKNSM